LQRAVGMDRSANPLKFFVERFNAFTAMRTTVWSPAFRANSASAIRQMGSLGPLDTGCDNQVSSAQKSYFCGVVP
jgi:hypothetical protein